MSDATHLTRMFEWSKNYFANVEKARMTYDEQNNEKACVQPLPQP